MMFKNTVGTRTVGLIVLLLYIIITYKYYDVTVPKRRDLATVASDNQR